MGGGLALNISKTDNSQDLELVLSVAKYFRVNEERANNIIQEVKSAVKKWRVLAKRLSIPSRETNLMKEAFHLAEDQ